MEIEDYDMAIKCFKSLKNFCKKWVLETRLRKPSFAQFVSGAQGFQPHLSNLYSQIGYLYRKLNMNRSACDYFKKQLIYSWSTKDIKNEVCAYRDLALCYFHLRDDPDQ